MKVPPYLKKGDTIGIVCPAGYMPHEKAAKCIETLKAWGFNVKVGKTVGNQFNYFSGTDEERLQDLQQMLNDKNIKSILCGRGGYGISRIIDDLDFSAFKRSPKWIIGYSDVTVLHAYVYKKLKVASLHAPMAGAFNDGGDVNDYVQSIKKAITGKKITYSAETHAYNRKGVGTGELVGGNLSIVCHLLGSNAAINTTNKILFLEDVGEYIYNIDRLFVQLKRAGKLENLSGLIIGGFTDMKDTVIPFGQQVYELIQDKIKDYDYPVCFDFPVSHSDKNYALKHGVKHELKVAASKVVLKQVNQA